MSEDPVDIRGWILAQGPDESSVATGHDRFKFPCHTSKNIYLKHQVALLLGHSIFSSIAVKKVPVAGRASVGPRSS